jgi:hypothetical protein
MEWREGEQCVFRMKVPLNKPVCKSTKKYLGDNKTKVSG